MREGIREKLEKDGFAVLEGFLSPEEVAELRAAGEALALNIPQEERRAVFSTTTTQQCKDRYFLESGDRVSFFFEEGALAEDGSILVEPHLALNKVGHALHDKIPAFKKVTMSDRIREVCYQMGMARPCVAQSMYIYKNPGVGGEVIPHQDATFLYTDPPEALLGIWIALDDATIENGCLWFSPGSHKSGVHRRFIRNPDESSTDLLKYDRGAPIYQRSNFSPLPVSKGSCVIIHGLVVHQSDKNKSSKSRHAYTFHIVDQGKGTYSPENWLQPTEQLPFPELYNDS